MTQTIIAFGCSHTFGEGLPDALVDPVSPSKRIPNASKYAWPAILGELDNKPVINLGTPGESNKFICNKILNYNFNTQEHIIIVMWTYFSRTCFFADYYKTFRLLPSNRQGFAGVSSGARKFNKEYYKKYFFYKNLFLESYQNINHAKLYLDKIGVKNYHFCVEEYPYYDNDNEEFLAEPNWNQVQLNYVKFIDDRALDGDHFSIAAHKNMAEQIYKKIKEA